jgi:hypothetical protein
VEGQLGGECGEKGRFVRVARVAKAEERDANGAVWLGDGILN